MAPPVAIADRAAPEELGWPPAGSGAPTGGRAPAFDEPSYGVYMACLVAFGLGLWAGLLPGSGPWALTLAAAVLGTVAITAGLALTRIPGDIDRRPRDKATGSTTLRRTLGRIGHLPAAAGRGARVAISLLRRR